MEQPIDTPLFAHTREAKRLKAPLFYAGRSPLCSRHCAILVTVFIMLQQSAGTLTSHTTNCSCCVKLSVRCIIIATSNTAVYVNIHCSISDY